MTSCSGPQLYPDEGYRCPYGFESSCEKCWEEQDREADAGVDLAMERGEG